MVTPEQFMVRAKKVCDDWLADPEKELPWVIAEALAEVYNAAGRANTMGDVTNNRGIIIQGRRPADGS